MTLQEQNVSAYFGLVTPGDDNARLAAFSNAKRHSRFVRFARIALPLFAVVAAIGIFAISGLFSNSKLAFSVDNVTIDGDGLTMHNARLTGVDQEKQFYEVVADTATQSLTNPDILNLVGIVARITRNEDGQGWADLVADEGVYDRGAEKLKLEENIRVRSNEGYDIRLKRADVDLGRGTVISQEPVTIDMLNGTLRAQGMMIENSGELLHFFNGVSLNFTPRKPSEPGTENQNE
ncbi:MAG: LPS export ABC transporter periplasmic protein LptC [Fimbriimonadaceae bacterium]|nr:LPS export ABC transporter periplasmic protein LptC [Alphaproteobacteria bacterium]